ncbi:MAG TPA: IS4 family transposase [Roseiarcus sp.]|nr:IS4 family transposase [Roseiarcus sp.]
MAYWRFLHNASVTCDVMLGAAARHTAEAARGRHVLAIQDTTELNFSGHVGSKRGFGVVGNGRDIGLFLHPVIVVEAGDGDPRQVGHAGGIVGLADANIYSRKKAPPGGRKSREKQRRVPRPIEAKETGRWVRGLCEADRLLSEAAMVTVVSDCERDIYEIFAAPRSAHVHLLVRAEHNRVLSDGGKLFATMAALPHVEGQEIVISAKDGRPARKARTRVSWQEIEAPRPRVGFEVERLPPTVKLNAVRVEEIDPPAGVKPIVWLLLTTHPVETLEDALRIVGWYRARWTIEQVFRVMKSQGFDLEDSQIETPEAMAKLALAVLIAALRTMQLVNARSGTTGQKLADAMDEAAEPLVEILTQKLEGKTLKLKNPHPTGTLARLAWVVGRLGGWDGYVGRGYKPPGPITIARGLIRFDAIREGWRLRQDV